VLLGLFVVKKVAQKMTQRKDSYWLMVSEAQVHHSGETISKNTRERKTETESNRERDTEKESSLFTGRILPSSIFILFRFQTIGWCYQYSGQLFLQHLGNVFWKYSHRHTQK
jgi:hypothetical protein